MKIYNGLEKASGEAAKISRKEGLSVYIFQGPGKDHLLTIGKPLHGFPWPGGRKQWREVAVIEKT